MEIIDDNLDHHHVHDQEDQEEEEEEALSLSELPLGQKMSYTTNTSTNSNPNRRSASEPPELFEFFSDLSSVDSNNMCSAEDIIFCGRLVPFREQSPPKFNYPEEIDKKQISGFRRRSESLSELPSSGVSRSGSSSKARMVMRNSRSLDYQKLRNNNSAVSAALDIERNPSIKSVGKVSDVSSKKAATRLRWSSFLMFGTVKFPAEMELGDIKSRQARRNVPITTTIFPPMDPGGNFPVSRSNSSKSGGGGSWRLLKALSCKDHASVAVTASFYVPQV
ncbi:hypothetical protein TIFTF001_021209 [Ficus carica]|uniref:Uncharacterized protein n=1 Tax=Ficus carica TaxID=3494 RepID=A0AA88AUR6_FICCA|nr:hypothetical protein TIFTF001_021209 [Ficus carica]